MASSALSRGDHFFEADGVRFHYLVRGTGPLVVYQSVGWGMPGSYLWNGMGPHLEKKNTVLYLEPRGNGQSTRPADAATMTAKTMAEDLEHLRKYLDLDVFPVLAGGSHSAAIVMRYAERYPRHVAKLVLISAQVMDSPPNTNMQDWITKRKDDPAYAPALAQLMELAGGKLPETDEKFGEVLDILLPWYFSNPSLADELRRDIADSPTLPTAYGLQTNTNDAKEENKLPQVAEADRITAKTLILWGEEDAMCSLTAAHALADGIPDSKLVIIPGSGHCPWIECPEPFWEALDLFLQC